MTSSDGRKATILIVDDEPAITRMLVEVLSKPELSVLTASQGDKAIHIYRQHLGAIDLVLLDSCQVVPPKSQSRKC
jgi:DNA-binding response OmpR family regulator